MDFVIDHIFLYYSKDLVSFEVIVRIIYNKFFSSKVAETIYA